MLKTPLLHPDILRITAQAGHHAKILIADDATSALDNLTEAKVLDAVRQRGCSVMLVASRLSTARAADAVAVLRDGRIVAVGTHAELAERDPDYRALLGLDRG